MPLPARVGVRQAPAASADPAPAARPSAHRAAVVEVAPDESPYRSTRPRRMQVVVFAAHANALRRCVLPAPSPAHRDQPARQRKGQSMTGRRGYLKPESVRQLAAFRQGEADAKAGRPDVQTTYGDPSERVAYDGGYGAVVSRPRYEEL
jgi:hypothetical protein